MSVGRDTDALWTPPPQAGDYRPTISIIESDGKPVDRRTVAVERVPFGFGRALFPDWTVCGIPRAGREHLGGCDLKRGHSGAHRYRAGNPAPIRPGATPA